MSNFQYEYGNAKMSEDKPWTAFFTGGNRLTQKPDKGSGYLRNNHNGRFRLEVTVNLNFDTLDSLIIDRNSAPSAIARPVLPVPYTGRGEQSAYGMAATFQVSAWNVEMLLSRRSQSALPVGPSAPPWRTRVPRTLPSPPSDQPWQH